MPQVTPLRALLLLVLVASVAVAEPRPPHVRNLHLSVHPKTQTQRIYAGGQIATVIRFEKRCDPARTKLLGWEGRFEPLVVSGRTVVLVPLHDLAPEDRFLLVVTLEDGTEVPFTVTGREGWVDQQVNVFPDSKTAEAVLASLNDALRRERELEKELERLLEEDTVDHALAALLAKKAVKMTPFRLKRTLRAKDDDATTEVELFTSKDKVAVLFRVTNHDPREPWRLREARLLNSSTGEARPFALRMDREASSPGETLSFAVIVDGSAFESSGGLSNLLLEIFRQDGLRQAYIMLDPRLLQR
jgi:uncharacterized protein (TIGR02268 family)